MEVIPPVGEACFGGMAALLYKYHGRQSITRRNLPLDSIDYCGLFAGR